MKFLITETIHTRTEVEGADAQEALDTYLSNSPEFDEYAVTDRHVYDTDGNLQEVEDR